MNIDLDKLEQVASKATPGPWRHRATDGGWSGVFEQSSAKAPICQLGFNHPANADFIAALSPDVVLELVRRLRAAEQDAKRYRGLRDYMHFSTSQDEVPEMGLRTWLQAPDHNPHADWVGDRFEASVDRCVDRFIAAQGASHD